MRPEISVIISAYNRAHLLAETVGSLLAQTLPAREIIVVDDGSTDNTAGVAESLGPLVKVIRRPNGGPSAARNTGFRASRGEFIHFFDSDDLAAANKHEVQVQTLINTGADIVVSPWVKGHFREGCFHADNLVLQQGGLPAANLIKALLTNWSFVPHSAMFRRGIVEAVGGFDEAVFGVEDQLMLLSCLLAGASIVHNAETIEFYRLGDDGKITENNEWKERRLAEWARFLLTARQVCLQKNIDPICWFGYRRRLWEVHEDLELVRCNEVDLMNRLHEIAPKAAAARISRYHRHIERFYRGVQQRLSGGRAHGAFRMGFITAQQVALLRKLGYTYVPPRRLPWPLHRESVAKPCVG